jgi:hypothetical protein
MSCFTHGYSKREAMRNMFAVASVWVMSPSLAGGYRVSIATSVADAVKRQEQNWAQAVAKHGAASVDQYEADDIITTDPTGRVTGKAQDQTDLSSGDYKIQSEQLKRLESSRLRQPCCVRRNHHDERVRMRGRT